MSEPISDTSAVDEAIDERKRKMSENENGNNYGDEDNKKKKDNETEELEYRREENEEFAYSKRADFTSEIHKIIVRGLPKYFGLGEIRKQFESITKVKTCKVIPMGKSKEKFKYKDSGVFVTFYCEEDRQIALDKLDGHVFKGKQLSAVKASACPDPFIMKQKQRQRNDKTEEELQAMVENCSLEKLKDNTIPLWNVPYEKQLEIKMEDIVKKINEMVRDIETMQPSLKPWFASQRQKYNGVPVELLDIRGCTQPNGYRNKCEFSIGLNPETKEKTVGFRYGKYSEGSVYVGPIYTLVHIPQRMKDAVKMFEGYVRQSSLDIFDVVNQTGHWKLLMCRYSQSTDQLMIKIGFDPQDLSQEEIDEVRKSLKSFFEESDEGKQLNCASVNFHLIRRRIAHGETAPPIELLSGSPTITQKLFDLSFNISPVSFFQINIEACHTLYNAVAELADLNKETTLFDICSGVGTIGLCLSNKCGEVLGVESNVQAVEDANINAKNNNITNCQFYAGKAEVLTSSLINRATFPHKVAVIDPPRAGIHQKLATTLRSANSLSNLIYLACDSKSVMNNFNGLSNSQSKKFHNSPYIPIKIIPVDMFPYTHNLEWVVCLKRYDELIKEQQKTEGSEKNEEDQQVEGSEKKEEQQEMEVN